MLDIPAKMKDMLTRKDWVTVQSQTYIKPKEELDMSSQEEEDNEKK